MRPPTSPFVERAAADLEEWIEQQGNPHLDVAHLADKRRHAVRFNGRQEAVYWYCRDWIHCLLYRCSPAEFETLRSHTSKREQVMDKTKPGEVRFHIATDRDLDILKQIIRARVQ